MQLKSTRFLARCHHAASLSAGYFVRRLNNIFFETLGNLCLLERHHKTKLRQLQHDRQTYPGESDNRGAGSPWKRIQQVSRSHLRHNRLRFEI